jgi:hypothetical protein
MRRMSRRAARSVAVLAAFAVCAAIGPGSAKATANSYTGCRDAAIQFPGDLRALLLWDYNDRPYRYVRSRASLPDLSVCDRYGTRTLRMKNYEIQRVVDGEIRWVDALQSSIRLVRGNSAVALNRVDRMDKVLLCAFTPSKSDGVARARVTYQLKWVPTNPERRVARAVTRFQVRYQDERQPC